MPLAQLPLSTANTKSRRYTRKTTEILGTEVDKQSISCDQLQPKTQPGNQIDEEMQPGYEPQQLCLQSDAMPREARDAFADMFALFRTQRNAVAVKACYSLLSESTRDYLCSLEEQQL